MRFVWIVFLLLPNLLLANEDLLARYSPLLDQCYGEADGTEQRTQCISTMSQTCIEQEDGGGSTLGISMCQNAEAEAWDVLLNDEYRQTMQWAKMADAEEAVYFPEFANLAKSLLAAQRAWITYRDAECELDYAIWGSGSMRHIAGTACIMQLTAERTIELRAKREFIQ